MPASSESRESSPLRARARRGTLRATTCCTGTKPLRRTSIAASTSMPSASFGRLTTKISAPELMISAAVLNASRSRAVISNEQLVRGAAQGPRTRQYGRLHSCVHSRSTPLHRPTVRLRILRPDGLDERSAMRHPQCALQAAKSQSSPRGAAMYSMQLMYPKSWGKSHAAIASPMAIRQYPPPWASCPTCHGGRGSQMGVRARTLYDKIIDGHTVRAIDESKVLILRRSAYPEQIYQPCKLSRDSPGGPPRLRVRGIPSPSSIT